MALSPFTIYPPERKVQSFVPPPSSTSVFKPSSELISASKAVQSPVWEFTSHASSTNKKSSQKQNVSSQSQGHISNAIGNKRKAKSRSRKRPRSKSPININIPHTIVVTSHGYDNDDVLTLPQDSSIDDSNTKKRGIKDVDMPDESRLYGSSSSKRSRSY